MATERETTRMTHVMEQLSGTEDQAKLLTNPGYIPGIMGGRPGLVGDGGARYSPSLDTSRASWEGEGTHHPWVHPRHHGRQREGEGTHHPWVHPRHHGRQREGEGTHHPWVHPRHHGRHACAGGQSLHLEVP